MIIDYDGIQRNIAIADFCLSLQSGDDLTEASENLKQWFDDNETIFLALSNIAAILRAKYADFEDMLSNFQGILNSMLPDAVGVIIPVMRFFDIAQSDDMSAITNAYSTNILPIDFQGVWTKLQFEAAKALLNILVTRRALTNNEEVAESAIALLRNYEYTLEYSNLNTSFLWRNLNEANPSDD